MKWFGWAGAAVVALGLITVFLINQNNDLQTTRYAIDVGLGVPIHIVHLSDLHGKQFDKGNNLIVEQVMVSKPDIVVFIGDLIDDDEKNVEESIDLLCKLAKQAPVFYVPGNHEHRTDKLPHIIEGLQQGGVHVMINAMETVEVNGVPVNLLGLDEGREDENPADKNENLFDQLTAKAGLKIVLSHYPENFALIGEDSYQNHDFDVMFAGHAHGGQFILPFIGGVFAPGQGFNPEYCAGVYGDGPYLVVSRGLGNSVFPFRLFNKPEVVEVTIQ